MTRRINKVFSLLLALIMAVSCFAGLAVTADAATESFITSADMKTVFTPAPGLAKQFPVFSSPKFTVAEAEWISIETAKAVATLVKDEEYILRLKFVAADGYKFEDGSKVAYIKALDIEGLETAIVSVVSNKSFEAWLTVKIPATSRFAVYFDANGGTGTMNAIAVEANAKYVIPSCKFTSPDKHKFECWLLFTNDGASVAYPGTTIDMTSDIYLIAQWVLGTASDTTYQIVDITSSKAGGKLFFSTKQAEYGARIIIEAVADKGYIFDKIEAFDELGRKIKITELEDNKFMFTMPNSFVSVNAEFKESQYVNCRKDWTCPLYRFYDVNLSGWYHDGIHYCVENGLMNGKSSTRFDPDGAMTRAQIVTVLWRYAGCPAARRAVSFNDVKDGDWCAEPIRWAASIGIISGYDNGDFRPNVGMTREQLALVLYRYASYSRVDVSVESTNNLRAYFDYDKISVYAQTAVAWVSNTGIMTGSANQIRPDDVVSRAQTAAMIVRFCEATTKK